jgi:hypothetical protein
MPIKEVGPCAVCIVSAMCCVLCSDTSKFLSTVDHDSERLDAITIAVVNRWLGAYYREYGPDGYEGTVKYG